MGIRGKKGKHDELEYLRAKAAFLESLLEVLGHKIDDEKMEEYKEMVEKQEKRQK